MMELLNHILTKPWFILYAIIYGLYELVSGIHTCFYPIKMEAMTKASANKYLDENKTSFIESIINALWVLTGFFTPARLLFIFFPISTFIVVKILIQEGIPKNLDRYLNIVRVVVIIVIEYLLIK